MQQKASLWPLESFMTCCLMEANVKHASYYFLQQGVGVEDPLVDEEGYPRADINLYQIRTARHNISCE